MKGKARWNNENRSYILIGAIVNERGKSMADTATPKSKKSKTTGTKKVTPVVATTNASEPTANTAEAKSRFSNAVNEAKAGAAALKAEAGERADAYKSQAQLKSREYGDQARSKASELAVDGKTKASEAISSLSKFVGENAATIDDKVGAKYGDYARSASRSLQETAAKIDQKSVEELQEDAREMVRKSPGMAVGIAAFAGFFLARLFGGSRR